MRQSGLNHPGVAMKHESRIVRIFLLLAFVAGLPLAALGAAGTVQFASGDVQMRRGDALAALARGALLESGDTVLTGVAGRAQLRFTDGGLVSLYPDSQFTVTRYSDSGDPAQDSFAVSLLRGGMRAITGLIGKRNPANYKLTTPTAVVGIRGSAFRLFFNDQGQLEVAGEQDEIEVCTQAGCVVLRVGESVLVLSREQLPVYTNTRAEFSLPQPAWPFAAGDQVRRDGTSAAVIVTPDIPVISPPTKPPAYPGNGDTIPDVPNTQMPGGTTPATGGTSPVTGGGTSPVTDGGTRLPPTDALPQPTTGGTGFPSNQS